MLYCPNPNCQSPNDETHHFCERCRTRLPKRYLWAIGDGADFIQPGERLGNRYLCKASRIFLDTYPGLSPDIIDSFPDSVLPYLKLNAYRLHLPQAYGWVQPGGTQSASPPILLLEQAAIAVPVQQRVVSGPMSSPASAVAQSIHPLPTLTSQWKTAPALRQLSWLWQIAKLWQPLATERVVSSLLELDLIRVEESVIRLLELRLDQRRTEGAGASLFYRLGELWQQWTPDANPSIQPFLAALCQHLIEGNIKHPGQLVACLDRALTVAGESCGRQVQLASQTDRGPTRPRNEDACYPSTPGTRYLYSKRLKKGIPPLDSSLVVVCDGIGGHLGGSVASSLAIETIYQHLQKLDLGSMTPLALMTELRKAACAANDVISNRNDQEERRDRERMGTTLVMGFVQNHELYITHLGDSRAYLITAGGCHQVTLDDDVASREARLGYGTYRSALTHPGSGSLVQALGMGPSGSLHPTVQRFVLEGQGVMLLCSDGLSDNDLVDSLWQYHLLPLLDSRDGDDLAAIANKLVNAANQHNGHDNVTVSLVRWVVQQPSRFKVDAKLATPPTLTSSIPGLSSKTRMQPSSSPGNPSPAIAREDSPTKLMTLEPAASSQAAASPPASPVRSLLSLLLGVVFLLSLGGVLAYVLLPSVSDRIDAWLGMDGQSYSRTSTSTESEEGIDLNPGDIQRNPALERPLKIGAVIQISRTDLTTGDDGRGTDSGSDGRERPSPDPDFDPPAEPAILRLYPEPSFRESASLDATSSIATSSPSGESGKPEGDRPPQSETPLSSSTPQATPPTPPSAPSAPSVTSDALPSSPESSDSIAAEPAESSVAPISTVAAPTPVAVGTLLRVMGQQEGEGDVRWIRLQVCHVPVKPDETIINGETQEPIEGIESGAEILAAGDAGWLPEHQIVTVAVLTPEPDETQLQGCELSVTP